MFRNFLLPFPIFFLITLLFSFPIVAQDDGTYDAVVTTNSGTYTVPVEVENGEVTGVHWPNGGQMTVNGADLESGEASGWNSRGESLEIEIDDFSYQDDFVDY